MGSPDRLGTPPGQRLHADPNLQSGGKPGSASGPRGILQRGIRLIIGLCPLSPVASGSGTVHRRLRTDHAHGSHRSRLATLELASRFVAALALACIMFQAHGTDPGGERRAQLIACAEAVARLARHREIEAVHVTFVKHDLEIRPVLDTIVRRWTRLTPTHYISTAAKKRGATLHREHVVPVRVLVDRMIMNPSECRALLEKGLIIASVTQEEHLRLGGIWTHHKDLYGRMLKAHVSRLSQRGMERYSATGIALQRTS